MIDAGDIRPGRPVAKGAMAADAVLVWFRPSTAPLVILRRVQVRIPSW